MQRSPLTLLFALLLIVPTFNAPAAAGPAPDKLTQVDAYLQQEMRDLKIPGMSVAIVQDGKLVHQMGYGQADGNGRPVTPDTPMALGSVTKSITATAILQLVEQGKVDLDTAVQRYIPDFRVADPVASSQITVRHLMNQTAGFIQSDGEDPLLGNQSLESRVAAYRTTRLTYRPGATYSYSNAHYIILGRVLEMVTGEPYFKYINEHIFTPLHMTHSTFSVADARRDGMAQGYFPWFGMPVADNTVLPAFYGPDHGGISAATDLSRYIMALLNGGTLDGATILTPESVATMFTEQSHNDQGGAYAFGWNVRSKPKADRHHGGWTKQFHAEIQLAPDIGLGVVMLANASDSVTLHNALGQVGRNVYHIMRDEPYKPVAPGARAEYRNRNILLVAGALALVAWAWLLGRMRRRPMGQGRRDLWVRAVAPSMLSLAVAAGALMLALQKGPVLVGLTWMTDLTLAGLVGCSGLALTGVVHLVLMWRSATGRTA